MVPGTKKRTQIDMRNIIESERMRHARKTGERAAVDLINAGYNVKIRRTPAGEIFLHATFRRRVKRGQHLRKCICGRGRS